MKDHAGNFFCVARYKFTLQICWRVNQHLHHLSITSEVNRTIRRCLFIVQSSGRICHFLPITKFSNLIGYELS